MTRKTLAMLAATTMLGAGSAMAATAWDKNEDGVVDAHEFIQAKGSAETFERLDANADGSLSPAEMGVARTAHVFLVADIDGDGALTRRELDGVTFYLYDADRNAMLDRDEMNDYSSDVQEGVNPFPNDAARMGSEVSQ